jgi:amino acid permease
VNDTQTIFCFCFHQIVALLGYAAFGSDVSSNLLLDITDVLPHKAMYVVWAFVIVKTATEATVYNQAAFTMMRDALRLTAKGDHADHRPKSRTWDVILRVVWVMAALLVAVFVPYFSDLTSITAAVSSTPLSFVYPVLFWNKKHGEKASKWRRWFHYAFVGLWSSLGVTALIGAIMDIRDKLSQDD